MRTWDAVKGKIMESFTEEEKQEVALMTELMCSIIDRREELNISQRKLESLTGLTQSSIARIEKLINIPQLDTLIKLITPLGLRLKVEKVEEDNI